MLRRALCSHDHRAQASRWGSTASGRAPLAGSLVLLLLSLLLAAPAQADRWYEHYARAETALENSQWSDAVRELNEALERKGDSGARERSYGMKVISYFPYLKLGIAYFHLGQYDPAVEAFATEERLGAVKESPEDMAALRRYRERATEARQANGELERQRIAEIVRAGVADAERLAAQGLLDPAINALDKALAVDPDNVKLNHRMAALREEALRRQRERQVVERATRLVADARVRLAADDHAGAASLLRQVIAIAPEGEERSAAQTLLETALRGLREAIPPHATRPQADVVAEAIGQARELETQGRLTEAMDRLQPALAIEPPIAEASALMDRLLAAHRQREDAEAVQVALADAEAKLARGDMEGVLSAANRVLAVDRGNASALDLIRRAYRAISARLLGTPAAQNLPPAIRFADLRETRDDGTRVQVVRQPELLLTGVVIDSSEVELSIAGDDGSAVPTATTSQDVGGTVITEFAVRRRLAPGSTTLRFAATDREGLSSSSEYAVLYLRPFYRAPWFVPALVALPLALGGVVLVGRARRRRRLLRRRFNPYVAGAPVLDERLFMGRGGLIDRILETIHSNSLLLYGERRIGKTSVQHHLRRRLMELDDPEYAFYPAYIDLQGTPEERFFATLAEGVFEELEGVLGGLQPSADLPGGEYGYRELASDLRRVVQVLEGRSDKRVKLVLLIDEVDELNSYDPRINQKLRSLFMRSFADNLVAVVSGVGIRKEWEREGSPWYNFFEEIEVGELGEEAARELVLDPIRGVVEVEDGVVERVVEVAGRKPYRIQRLCIALVNRMHEAGRKSITLEDVENTAGDAEG